MSRFDAGLIGRALEWARRGQDSTPSAPPAAPVLPDLDRAVNLAAALCRRFEGFRASPYLCPAGVATIGYGTTTYDDGKRVLLTDPPVTREQADTMLSRRLRRVYLPALLRACPALATAPPGRVAALLDWTYNLGEGNLRASTLRRRVNAGEWNDVPAELRRWVFGGGVRLPGLVARREAEVEHL